MPINPQPEVLADCLTSFSFGDLEIGEGLLVRFPQALSDQEFQAAIQEIERFYPDFVSSEQYGGPRPDLLYLARPELLELTNLELIGILQQLAKVTGFASREVEALDILDKNENGELVVRVRTFGEEWETLQHHA